MMVRRWLPLIACLMATAAPAASPQPKIHAWVAANQRDILADFSNDR